jgi:hypothetical protein
LGTVGIDFAEFGKRVPNIFEAEQLVSVSDTFDREVAFYKLLTETISAQETYWDVIQFRLGVSESISATDSYLNRPKKIFLTNIHLTEHTDKSHLKTFFCELNFSERYTATIDFFRSVEEQISVLEECFKHTAVPFEEWFNVAEYVEKTYDLLEQEDITLSDFIGHIWNARKKLADFITIHDIPANSVAKSLVDSFVMLDDILQASGQVLNNIIVSHGAMDLSKFMELSSKSPGYSKFVEFKVGEYDYKDALVMLKVSCMVEQSKPSINNLIMHVDIPDTDDRGTAKIASTTAATRVRFNQPYYNPPEVSVVLRAGNTESGILTPYVVSVTNEYFDVELRNQNMELATGTISWVAKGY